MNFTEANKIFKIWSKWYWPSHFILHSVFLNKIPESFLPYQKNVLEEALNIIAKQYYDNGDFKVSKNIQESIASLAAYVRDDDALQQVSDRLSDVKMREAILIYISNFKKDWKNWLDKQED